MTRFVIGLLWALVWTGLALCEPAAFSHKRHANLKLGCTGCHTGVGRRMGVGTASQCVSCHRTVRRAPPAKREQVYEVPDFVWFSHARHRGVDCAKCHGPVWQRDVITREVDHTMEFCRSCHLERGAKAICGTCHVEK